MHLPLPIRERQELVRLIRDRSRPSAPQPTGAESRLPDPEPPFRAVLFDVYGTLIGSGVGDIGLAGGERGEDPVPGILRRAGLEPDWTEGRLDAQWRRIIERHHRQARGRGIRHPEVDIAEVWRQLVRTGDRPRAEEERLVRRAAVEFECLCNPCWPSPGCLPLLERCRRAGLAMGIVSNAQFYTPLMLEALLGAPPEELGFDPDLLVWSYREGEAKPEEGLYRKALSRLETGYGILPRETLMVGNDMLKDVAPAQQAGCRGALFAGDRRSYRPRIGEPGVEGQQPWAILSSLSDLEGILPGE